MLVVGNILGRKTGGATGGISFPLLENSNTIAEGSNGVENKTKFEFDVSNFSTLYFEKVGFENSYNNHAYIYGDETKIYEKLLATGTNEYNGDALDISSYSKVTIELRTYHTTGPIPNRTYLKGVTIS